MLLPLLVVRNTCAFSIHNYMNQKEKLHYFRDDNFAADYEIVYLPVLIPTYEAFNDNGNGLDAIEYDFQAFGKPVTLKLKRNVNLLAPNYKSYIHEDNYVRPLSQTKQSGNCHFLHIDDQSVGAISNCIPNSIHGLIFLSNSTLEILPLSNRLQNILKVSEPLLSQDAGNNVPHIVQRSIFSNTSFESDDQFADLHNIFKDPKFLPLKDTNYPEPNDFFDEDNFIRIVEAASNRPVNALTVELALFFDAAAYRIFSPYMNNKDVELENMILAYMNGVQALYHHPSLGTSLELVLVRLDIMKTQPTNMPHYDGERSKLLDSFCAYQNSINPLGDDNPDHWDMALYVSGLDFYAIENGRKSGVTMGLATVGGVCLGQYACVIAELGTTNIFGKPYPSAGFTSVYILAHEIGHNLGMHHDSSSNSCPKEGYIMSPSRGTNGETQWSSCSADVMTKLSWATCLRDSGKPPTRLDHSKFMDSPGQMYTSKKQCEILLRDKDAIMSPNQKLNTICYSLQCKTPRRSGYYFAGPALDGTECGNKQYCFGGECVNKVPPKPPSVIPGGWSPWKTGVCISGCLFKSKGSVEKNRNCNNPAPVNTDKGCDGSSYEKGFCDDRKVCARKQRVSATQHASERCKKFAALLPQLDKTGSGLQAPHEEARLWMGCAIFCRRADSGSYYTPRIELNDLGVSPYFPDGTWCHNDKTGQYYCLQHHCLPENFEFTKSSTLFLNGLGDDIPLSQNAHPNDLQLPPDLLLYLSLGPDGKPLQTTIRPDDINLHKEEDWETDDYIELPDDKLNEIHQHFR